MPYLYVLAVCSLVVCTINNVQVICVLTGYMYKLFVLVVCTGCSTSCIY